MSTERPGDTRPVNEIVDQAWRDASTEVPGPRSDAAILAAARAEVARRPATDAAPGPRGRRDWWTRWQPLAAAATVAGLAFVLVQTIPRDRDVAPQLAIEKSRPQVPGAARSAEPSAPSADAAAPVVEAAPPREVPRAREAPPAVTSNEAAIPPPAGSAVATEAEAPTDADAAAGARYRAAAPAPSPAAVPAPALAPEDWAVRIESLYDAGNLAGAAAELQAFRAEYRDADRHLPETLHKWAASVK